MNEAVIVPSADVLRNRGVQLKVHAIDTVDGIPVRRMDGDSPVYEHVWVRFDNWTIANIEETPPEGFGSVEGWQWELDNRPTRAVAKTFALVFDHYTVDAKQQRVPDIRWATMRLMDNNHMFYGVALTNAMFIANGMDPESVGEVLKRALKELEQGLVDGAKAAMARLAEEDFHPESSITETTPTGPSQSTPDSSSSSNGHEQEGALTSTGV